LKFAGLKIYISIKSWVKIAAFLIFFSCSFLQRKYAYKFVLVKLNPITVSILQKKLKLRTPIIITNAQNYSETTKPHQKIWLSKVVLT
jgi:hypothetical protein